MHTQRNKHTGRCTHMHMRAHNACRHARMYKHAHFIHMQSHLETQAISPTVTHADTPTPMYTHTKQLCVHPACTHPTSHHAAHASPASTGALLPPRVAASWAVSHGDPSTSRTSLHPSSFCGPCHGPLPCPHLSPVVIRVNVLTPIPPWVAAEGCLVSRLGEGRVSAQ
jgi:hypothetical protein